MLNAGRYLVLVNVIDRMRPATAVIGVVAAPFGLGRLAATTGRCRGGGRRRRWLLLLVVQVEGGHGPTIRIDVARLSLGEVGGREAFDRLAGKLFRK